MMSRIELAIALLVVVVATVCDVRARRIPDWLTYSATALALGLHGLVWTSAFGAVACAAIPYVFFRLGKLGLGDVKLFLTLGAILGPSVGFEVELVAFVLAFPIAVLLRLRARKIHSLPFAPAICAAVLVAGILQG